LVEYDHALLDVTAVYHEQNSSISRIIPP